MTYTILDLFCGAGGAGYGYHLAGFDVTGVDIRNMKRYPFEFHRADALAYLDAVINYGPGWFGIDAIHASPPCQHWSRMSNCRPGLKDQYPQLIEPVRERLQAIGLPYVIENVPGAPLKDPVILCGSSFGLGSHGLQIRRHRLFETSFHVPPLECRHSGYTMNPHAETGRQRMRDAGFTEYSRPWTNAMGVPWMTTSRVDAEAREAIPPAYTEYVGLHLRYHLMEQGERLAA